MKKLFLAIILLSFFGLTYGQNMLPIGKSQVNFGIGASGWGVPVYIGIDYGIHKDITIGGQLSYSSYRDYWNDSYYQQNIMGFSGNGNYHFNTLLNIPRQFDFYAGLNLGFYVWNSPSGYGGANNSGLGLGAQVGGRYYFSKKGAINLELGDGNAFSDVKFGLTFKL